MKVFLTVDQVNELQTVLARKADWAKAVAGKLEQPTAVELSYDEASQEFGVRVVCADVKTIKAGS